MKIETLLNIHSGALLHVGKKVALNIDADNWSSPPPHFDTAWNRLGKKLYKTQQVKIFYEWRQEVQYCVVPVVVQSRV